MFNLVIIGAVESTEIAIKAASRVDGWRVRAVVTLPPALARRHSDFRNLKGVCEEVDAELIYAPRINDAEILEQIRSVDADLLLVVGWSQICGPDFLDIVPNRVLGYHPAALPRLRGRAAIPWTILANEPITAGTLFWIDQGTDTGKIFVQRFFHVAPDETARSLYSKHMAALAEMTGEALLRLREGDAEGAIQDEAYATYAARRTEADGHIDWSEPTESVTRLIRAVGRPYPGAFTLQGDERITLWEARPVIGDARHLAAPGQIVKIDGNEFWIKATDGLIHVTEWESEPGTRLKIHAVLS